MEQIVLKHNEKNEVPNPNQIGLHDRLVKSIVFSASESRVSLSLYDYEEDSHYINFDEIRFDNVERVKHISGTLLCFEELYFVKLEKQEDYYQAQLTFYNYESTRTIIISFLFQHLYYVNREKSPIN